LLPVLFILVSSPAAFLVDGLGLCRLSLVFREVAGLAWRELFDFTSSTLPLLTDGLGLSLALPFTSSNLLFLRGGLSPFANLSFFASPSFFKVLGSDGLLVFLSELAAGPFETGFVESVVFLRTVFFGVSLFSTFLDFLI